VESTQWRLWVGVGVEVGEVRALVRSSTKVQASAMTFSPKSRLPVTENP